MMKHSVSSLLIASAIFAFAILGCVPSNHSSSVPPNSTPIPVAAATLISTYESNEVAADEKYKGKLVAVTGKVEDVGKDILSDMYVTLESGTRGGFASVQCMFAEEHKAALASLRKGEVVTIVGVCEGKLGNVVIKDSHLQ